MAIVGRALEGITMVAVTAAPPLPMPAPETVFGLFSSHEVAGARFLDDTALGIRIFTLPALALRLIFEPTRIRIEATTAKKPEELPLAEYLCRVVEKLYNAYAFPRYGFNYDVVYQYDAVIPQRHILGVFLDDVTVDAVTHFGWQVTIGKEKGKRREQYFFKIVSPLELRVLGNIELDKPLPKLKDAQKEFVRCYTESQSIVEHVRFS